MTMCTKLTIYNPIVGFALFPKCMDHIHTPYVPIIIDGMNGNLIKSEDMHIYNRKIAGG